MNILGILVIVAYVLAMILRWYQNYFQVQRCFDPPPFRWSQSNLPLYRAISIISFVITYGSIVGIWYYYGLWAGLGALVFRFVIGYISWGLYFNRRMAWLADIYYQQMRLALSDSPVDKLRTAIVEYGWGRNIISEEMHTWDEARLRGESHIRADEWIQERMREGQYL